MPASGAKGVVRRQKKSKTPEIFDDDYKSLSRRAYDYVAKELSTALKKANQGDQVAKLTKALRDLKRIRDEALGGAPESVDQKGPGGRFDVSQLGPSSRS